MVDYQTNSLPTFNASLSGRRRRTVSGGPPSLVNVTFRRLHELISAFLPAKPADVLELGSGLDFLSSEMARRGHRVVGMDKAHG